MQSNRSDVIVERHAAQLRLTLNRPAKANALTVAMMERMAAEITNAGADPAVRAIVVTGAGDRFFSAGADVREPPDDGDPRRHRQRRTDAHAALQDAALDAPKPIVVALNGAAIGAGTLLALIADACIAADTASLSLPEIDLPFPTFLGAGMLEAIGGRALALDLIQSGRRMPAHEAARRGLIRAALPPGELQAAASEIADVMGSKDPSSFAENKRWINRSLKAALTEAREEHARHRTKVAA